MVDGSAQDLMRNPRPPALSYRFMSRLVEREFAREDSGVCLAFSAPDSEKASADAVLMLAYCLQSELGSRVLIVDARFEDTQAGVTGRLGLARNEGVAEILRQGFDGRENLVVATPVPNVDVLPAGDPEGQGAAPVDRAKVRKLFEAAAARYDYVLVQVSSPLRETRTLVIAAEATAVFLLAEDNQTFMKTLDELPRYPRATA